MEYNTKYDQYYSEHEDRKRQKEQLVQEEIQRKKILEEIRKKDDYFAVGIIRETLEEINIALNKLNLWKKNNFNQLIYSSRFKSYLISKTSNIIDWDAQKNIERQLEESALKCFNRLIQKEESCLIKIREKYIKLYAKLNKLEKLNGNESKYQLRKRKRFLLSIKRKKIILADDFYIKKCIQQLNFSAFWKKTINRVVLLCKSAS